MTDKPKEDILVSPEYATLEFGDGYIALIQGGKEEATSEGEKVVDFTIKPSSSLRKRYDIKDNVLDRNMNMTFRVKKKDLVPLNLFDDANKKWLYIKNFNHDETEISNIGWSLREQLTEAEKKVIILEGENIWLSEQLQLAKTNPSEFLKQGTEVFEAVSSKMIDLLKGRKDREDM